MKPKYLGMWVHSAVGIFWIAMFVPQRKYSGNKGDDTGLSENLTQMWEKKKKHKDNTTLQIKSSYTPSKKNLNGRYAASR